jgi:hypothetical protein
VLAALHLNQGAGARLHYMGLLLHSQHEGTGITASICHHGAPPICPTTATAGLRRPQAQAGANAGTCIMKLESHFLKMPQLSAARSHLGCAAIRGFQKLLKTVLRQSLHRHKAAHLPLLQRQY